MTDLKAQNIVLSKLSNLHDIKVYKEVRSAVTELLKEINKEQLTLTDVVSSFVYVLKAKGREEPLGIYKTYQKAYRSKTNFAKMNWTNTYIEKWKIF